MTKSRRVASKQKKNKTEHDDGLVKALLDQQEARELKLRAIPIASVTIGMIVFFDGALWMTLQIEKFEPEVGLFLTTTLAFFALLFTRPFSTFTSRAGRYLNASYFVVKVIAILPGILLCFALLYRSFGLIDGEERTSDPNTCLYFSIVTWTTLGYGDVRPIGFSRAIAACQALLGHLAMTIFIVILAVKLQYIVNKFTPDEPMHSSSGTENQTYSWKRLFKALKEPSSNASHLRVIWFGICVALLSDCVVGYLFFYSPEYDETIRSIAVYGMPFILASMLVQGKLFIWRDEITYYYERAYFAVKAMIAVPGIIMAYAYSYRVLGLFEGNQRVTDAGTALYFSVVTWTTLGYGDIRPTPAARLLAASEALVGYITMAVFIGIFANVFLGWFFEIRKTGSIPRKMRL